MNLSIPAVSDIAAFMLQASIKATLLVALVLLMQKLLGKFLTAQGRFLLWVPVVVSLVAPVGFGISLPGAMLPQRGTPVTAPTTQPVAPIDTQVAPAMQDAGRDDTAVHFEPLPERNVVTAPAVTTSSAYSWTSVLPYAWLAGVLVVLGTIAATSYRFAQVVRRAAPAPAGIQAVLDDCMRETRCATHVRVLSSMEADVPMIAGLFKPVLLLPAGLEQWVSGAQLRHVFIHELMHLQRGDIAGNWIVAIVQALHWFNPLVWYAFFRMRQDRELACDAATLRHLAPGERSAYGQTLLQLNDMLPGLRVPALALSMLHGGSVLRTRIVMLAEPAQRSVRHGVTVALVLVPLTAFAFSQPMPASDDVPSSADAASIVVEATSTSNTMQDIAEVSSVEEEGVDAEVSAPAPQTTLAPTVRQETVAAAAEPREPDTVLQRVPAQIENTATATPPVNVLAAASVMPEESTPAEPTPPAPYAGLAEIERLAETLAAMKSDKLGFVEKWNGIGTQCDARKDRFLGALSASCQRIRTAQRRGEIFRFAYECYQLEAIHEELAADYRKAAPQQREHSAEDALRNNARELAAICSEDTYASQYPAFAAMFADAEALKYYPHRAATARTVGPAVASFSDVFFHHDRAGGNTGLGTGGTSYSPGYPNPDTVVPGIFGSGIPAGGAAVAPTPAQ